jgi:CRISPR system Cascade subunit CasC
MFIELHMIQNFAPSNLNRDDTNNPKDCEFGGARRARISSQCIKRAMRTTPVFAKTTEVKLGTRTKRLMHRLSKRLIEAGKPAEDVNGVLADFVPKYASKLDSKKGDDDGNKKTAVLLYISEQEMDHIAETLLETWDELSDKKTVGKVARRLVRDHEGHTSAPDIALFGRMLAEKPRLNLDAACQVAHALSTHRVTMEMDFYTAVDDLAPGEETGAGMMGFTGYNSACFYRYARIDWDQLVENLNDDADLAARTVEGFMRAAVEAVPSGKQNAFAAHNPPDFLLAVVREDGMGWSLVNAFEKPVRSYRDSGLVAPSVKELDTYWGRLCQVYGTDTLTSVSALSLDPELSLDHLADDRVENQDEWIGAVVAALPTEEETA